MTALPGTLLGGKVGHAQFADSYRTGIEPVLLAAVVPARAGERVIEAGCAAGAGLLCLAWRVPGMAGVGVEREAHLAGLARTNAIENGWQERLSFVTSDIEAFGQTHAGPKFAHAMANPPWHDPAGTASPDPGRAAAKIAHPGLLAGWTAALARCLRPRGTLSLILDAAHLDAGIDALRANGLGTLRILPCWPRQDQPARLILLQATSGGRGATRLLPGLILHGPGGYTTAAQNILTTGAALGMG